MAAREADRMAIGMVQRERERKAPGDVRRQCQSVVSNRGKGGEEGGRGKEVK